MRFFHCKHYTGFLKDFLNFLALREEIILLQFHYSKRDFVNTLKCARQHLQPGGVFIFDVWFGPAVLKQKPGSRKKVVKQGQDKVIRLTRSTLDVRRHIVKVVFDLKHMRDSHMVEQVKETHLMRFFFNPEIDYLAKIAGFKTSIISAFLTQRQNVTENDWNICVVLK